MQLSVTTASTTGETTEHSHTIAHTVKSLHANSAKTAHAQTDVDTLCGPHVALCI